MSDRQAVHVFSKNARERIEVSLMEYKGAQYVDLRVFYEADGNEWKPSKKGICVSVGLLDELEVAMAKLKKLVRAESAA